MKEIQVGYDVKTGIETIKEVEISKEEIMQREKETLLAKLKEELYQIQAYLLEFDYVKIQWDEEEELMKNGMIKSHHRAKKEYLSLLKQREEKRARQREIKEEINDIKA